MLEIINTEYHFSITTKKESTWLNVVANIFLKKLPRNTYPLRFSIVEITKDNIVIEATIVKYSKNDKYASFFQNIEITDPHKKMHQASPFVVVQVIPTGILCEIGGFAGDATPATNLLASAVDLLITHPNTVNASDVNEMSDNILYVEGKSLDDFLLGHIGLRQVISNKIGTFVDPTGLEQLDFLVSCLNTAKAVKGIDCNDYTILKEKLGVHIEWSKTGCAVGRIDKPLPMLEGVEELLNKGATAIGGTSVVHGSTKEIAYKHLHGLMPNPSGGVEAVITHLISKIFRIPTAHSPLPFYTHLKTMDTINPRSSAEFISTPHFFCVLKGLHKAPHLIPINTSKITPSDLVTINNVGAIILPASALGGIPALVAEYNNIPLIAVKENKTILTMTNTKLKMNNVIEVDTYLEAAGVVLSLKNGISLESLKRPIERAENV
jgi:hypothetical protein